MSTLRLEELESRHLLSGGYFAPQAVSPHSFSPDPGPGPGPAIVADRPPAGAYGGPGPSDWAGPGWGTPPPQFDGGGMMMVVVIVERMPPPASGAELSGVMPVSAGNPRPGVIDVGSAVTAAESAAVRAAAVTRPSLQTPFVLTAAVNTPTLAIDVRSPIAAQLPIQVARPGDAVIVSGPGWPSQVPASGGTATPPAADDGEPADATPALTAASLLSALPAVDLSALGHGLQQFLGQLERAGEELIGDGGDLRPWLVATAAAATACEIARRQWARAQKSEVRSRRSGLLISDL